MQIKVFEAKRKLIELDKQGTALNVKSIKFGHDTIRNRRMILQVFQQHNDQIKALLNKDFTEGTIERHIISYICI